jgi:uncharacterized Zn finger protein (UPF0148 family)
MNAGTECWECGKSVPETELEERNDGRLVCCRCRLKELEEEPAEKTAGERSRDQDRSVAELLSQSSAAAPRELPSTEPDSGSWSSAY